MLLPRPWWPPAQPWPPAAAPTVTQEITVEVRLPLWRAGAGAVVPGWRVKPQAAAAAVSHIPAAPSSHSRVAKRVICHYSLVNCPGEICLPPKRAQSSPVMTVIG